MAGVADTTGYGWAIARVSWSLQALASISPRITFCFCFLLPSLMASTDKELANAGATIVVGTWPPVLKMFLGKIYNVQFQVWSHDGCVALVRFNMALKKKATDEDR